MMQTIEWDHLQFWSHNPEASARWFETHLGATLCPRAGRIDVTMGGVTLFVARPPEGRVLHPSPAHAHIGFDHIGLRVADLAALAADLKAAGVHFTQEVTVLRPGVKACFIEGPEGVSIELLQRDPPPA
jgi:lactoylglutathione lyase